MEHFVLGQKFASLKGSLCLVEHGIDFVHGVGLHGRRGFQTVDDD